jgi:hypothetical protein
MPRITISPELKEAISDISQKEKDRLIFRLLPKDPKLIDKLSYQLLENAATQEERREELNQWIVKKLSIYPAHYYSPGYLLLTFREISGRITYHKDITGDKLGEIELTYLMMAEGIERNISQLKRAGTFSAYSFNEYVVKRILKLITLSKKIHEDLHLEFEDNMVKLGQLLKEIPSMGKVLEEYDLDINWLINAEIPE